MTKHFIAVDVPRIQRNIDDSDSFDWDITRKEYINISNIERITDKGIHLVSGTFVPTLQTADEILEEVCDNV